jgi:hypothetical protein
MIRNRKMLLLLGVALLVGLVSSANGGLLAHYKFEGNTDSETGNFHGDPYGDPTYESGQFGDAINFDGDWDWMFIPGSENNFGGLITNRITIAGWIKVTAFDKTWQNIFGSAADQLFYSRWQAGNFTGGGKIYADEGTMITGNWSAAGNVNDGQWHHFAFIYDGATFDVQIDGVPGDNVTATNGYIQSMDVILGFGNSGLDVGTTAYSFNGLMDDIGIWNEGLNQETLDYIRANGVPEPASMVLLGLGGMALIRRRKKV